MALAERLFGAWDVAADRDRAAVRDRRHGLDRRSGRPRHPPAGRRSRPRSGSATAGCRAGSPTSMRVSVMSAILGGLFNSRLNMKLREEKGYTYGAGAGFDMRRGAGPFSAPSRPAGRCSPSRRAGPAPAPTRCAATACCSTAAGRESSGSSSAGTRRCPGR